jgi:hypothetical protein
VPRRVEALELDCAADFDHVAFRQAPVHAADAARRAGVRHHLRMGRADQAGVAAGVIAMLVGVEDLRDRPPARLRCIQAQPPFERVDRQRLAGLRAGDQVVEVAVVIGGPDAFDEHARILIEVRAERRVDRRGSSPNIP